MSANKIRTGFRKYTDSDFLVKARYILDCMTGNPDFTYPMPPLDEIKAALLKYSSCLLASETSDRSLLAQKRISRRELELLLVQLGMFVMFTGKDDIAILTGSGFTLAKEPEKLIITQPGNVTLSNGITSGEMAGLIKAQKAARLYHFEITDQEPDENTAWKTNVSSRRSFVFRSLVPGKKYWIRVAVIGSCGQIAYSPVTSRYAL